MVDSANKYTQKEKERVAGRTKRAVDGDHYRLTFDKPGTRSWKCNLVGDELMKLQIFPENVGETEIAYYLSKQNKYGLRWTIAKPVQKSPGAWEQLR